MPIPGMTPQMMAMLALQNPELLASALAARGARPEQLQGGTGIEALIGGGGAPAGGGLPLAPGPTSGMSPTQMVNPIAPAGGTSPVAVPQPAMPAPAAATNPPPALGDILAGVGPSAGGGGAGQMRAPGIAPMGQTMAQPNILALMQYLAQGGAAPGGMPSLGALLGR
jgi:hypothetical protein